MRSCEENDSMRGLANGPEALFSATGVLRSLQCLNGRIAVSQQAAIVIRVGGSSTLRNAYTKCLQILSVCHLGCDK